MEEARETRNVPEVPGGDLPEAPLIPGVSGIQDLRAEIVTGLTNTGQMTTAEAELSELEGMHPGIVSRLFPESEKPSGMSYDEYATRSAAKLQKVVAQKLLNLAAQPGVNSPAALEFQELLDRAIAPSISAGLIGEPIERLPGYQSFKELCLITTGAKDFYNARSGIDPLEYEDPMARSEAYNFDPEGGGSRTVAVEGNRTTVYPYFKETPKHVLSFWEWAKRQIKPIVYLKKQILQELAKGWDDDLITLFDATVPDGTLYSSHPTHITTITNADGAVTYDTFVSTAKFLLHVDSSSGTVHAATPGVALCDVNALFDIRDWGTDVWTDEEVSQFDKDGFGVKYDESLVVGKRISGFSLLQTPIQQSGVNRKVRFFGAKLQVGYWIPITIQGKRIVTQGAPMQGNDPDWSAIRNVATPPGFTFTIQAWMGGALHIANPYALAMINHS